MPTYATAGSSSVLKSSDIPRKTYQANCHCGAVRLEITMESLEDGKQVGSCQCSICTKNGYLGVYPKREDFELLRGAEHLKAYQFGDKEFEHFFCTTCGTSVYADCPTDPFVCVNARTFKDIDISKLSIRISTKMKYAGVPYDIGP